MSLERPDEVYRNLQAILDSMGDGVLVTDAEGRLVLYNSAAEQLLGIERADIAPDMWPEYYGLYLPDTVTRYPADELPLARAMRGQAVDTVEVYQRRPDAEDGRWFSVTARPLRDELGAVRGGVAVVRDTTARRRAEDDLTRFAADLARANRMLQDFATVASHELRAPLRKVRIFARRLESDSSAVLGSRGRDYLVRLGAAAERMQHLVDDLLELSRVSSRAPDFESVELDRVARAVLSDLEIAIETAGAEVTLDGLPSLEADPRQMRQLLANLIENALKFQPKGRAPRVRLAGRYVPGADAAGRMWAELRVIDNGIGFEPRYAEQVFDIFERLHGSARYEGTGVGLAICRKIVERHGGEITAVSQPGEGATFQVRLPRWQRPPRAGGNDDG